MVLAVALGAAANIPVKMRLGAGLRHRSHGHFVICETALGWVASNSGKEHRSGCRVFRM